MTPEECAAMLEEEAVHLTDLGCSQYAHAVAHLRRLAALERENERLREALGSYATLVEAILARVAREALEQADGAAGGGA